MGNEKKFTVFKKQKTYDNILLSGGINRKGE